MIDVKEFQLAERKVQLPDVPRLRLSSDASREIHRFARTVIEHHALSERRLNAESTGRTTSSETDFFEQLDPATGFLKDSARQRLLVRIADAHDFRKKNGFPVLPAARTHLMTVLKKEYESFVTSHRLPNSPESYGLFMTGVALQYADAFSNFAKSFSDSSANVHWTGSKDFMSSLEESARLHAPSPFSHHIDVSPFSCSGDPAPTRSNLESGEHYLLEAVHAASPWLVAQVMDPSLEHDRIRSKFIGVRLARDLSRIAKHYGLDPN